MIFRGVLLLVVFSCYVSAESDASVVSSPLENDRILSKQHMLKGVVIPPTEDDGVWIKNDPHVLKAGAGSKNTPTSSPEPPAPPTEVPPTPVVPDEKGDWMVNYTSSSAVCIRLVAELKVKVGYIKGNETGESEVVVPSKAVASGDCATGTMVLSWPFNGTKTTNSIHFWFTLDNATHVWTVYNTSGFVTVPVLSKTTKTSQNIPLYLYDNTTCLFNSHLGMSYKCLRSDSYQMSINNTSHNSLTFTSANLTFSQLQLEAFKPNITDNAVFGSPNNCEITPDMVPIAVGCALAGLVVIVLVAYLIAQRKPAEGYRSV